MALPSGPVPIGIPYGIGKRIYLNGYAYDLSSRWTALATAQAFPELGDVTVTRGVIVFSIYRYAIDPLAMVGAFRPGATPVSIRSVWDFPGLATTSGGLITTGLSNTGQSSTSAVFTTSGQSYRPGFTDPIANLPITVTVQGAGGSFVYQAIDPYGPAPEPSYRLYPGYPASALPFANTFGVGGGLGWLATAGSPTSVCYRTAALATPTTLRARICSQTLPLLSPNGALAVVVQGGHVRLYDTLTGLQVNAANAPTLPFSTAVRPIEGYYPFAWETSTTYLVHVADGLSLFILRCTTAGRCERAVTSSVRSGVSDLVVPLPPFR